MDIMEQGIRRLEVGYEAPITWKFGEPEFTSNRPLAELRLNCLLRKFERDEDFEQDYRASMEKNFTQGYAVVLDQPEHRIEKDYIIPHHGVRNGSKLRVVFYAAAKFRGRSLNKAMLSGPAL